MRGPSVCTWHISENRADGAPRPARGRVWVLFAAHHHPPLAPPWDRLVRPRVHVTGPSGLLAGTVTLPISLSAPNDSSIIHYSSNHNNHCLKKATELQMLKERTSSPHLSCVNRDGLQGGPVLLGNSLARLSHDWFYQISVYRNRFYTMLHMQDCLQR